MKNAFSYLARRAHSAQCADCVTVLNRAPRNTGRALIWIYRHSLSLLVGYNCRHLPTCSVYADEAIERFGLWAGGWMTLARLLRCQPWGTSGIDNVPLTAPPRDFTVYSVMRNLPLPGLRIFARAFTR